MILLDEVMITGARLRAALDVEDLSGRDVETPSETELVRMLTAAVAGFGFGGGRITGGPSDSILIAMEGDAVQRIASAVAPAVMVSACGLIALGLDNQSARMTTRMRDLMREYRSSAEEERRPGLRDQVAILARRHRILSRALFLDYSALLAFVLTSLLSLAQGITPLSPAVPLCVFAAGVVFMGLVALFALASVRLAGVAIRIEQADLVS